MKVTITRNGKLLFQEWSDESQCYYMVEVHEISDVLFHVCEVEPGTTFGTIFNLFIKHQHAIDQIFVSHMGGAQIGNFIDQWVSTSTKKTMPNGIDYLEVYWGADIIDETFRADQKEKPELDDYVGFHACGRNKIFNDNASLLGVPINELKSYEVRINNSYTIMKLVGGALMPVIDVNKPIDMYHFIGGIMYELTFLGDRSLSDLTGSMFQFEDDMDPERNESACSDTLLLEIYEADLKHAIENENYEHASRLRDKIQKLKFGKL